MRINRCFKSVRRHYSAAQEHVHTYEVTTVSCKASPQASPQASPLCNSRHRSAVLGSNILPDKASDCRAREVFDGVIVYAFGLGAAYRLYAPLRMHHSRSDAYCIGYYVVCKGVHGRRSIAVHGISSRARCCARRVSTGARCATCCYVHMKCAQTIVTILVAQQHYTCA
jgi:hypothetical protein